MIQFQTFKEWRKLKGAKSFSMKWQLKGRKLNGAKVTGGGEFEGTKLVNKALNFIADKRVLIFRLGVTLASFQAFKYKKNQEL